MHACLAGLSICARRAGAGAAARGLAQSACAVAGGGGRDALMALRLSCLLLLPAAAAATPAAAAPPPASTDWLVVPPTTPVTLQPWSSQHGRAGWVLTNGLISRHFALDEAASSWATWDFVSHLEDSGDASLLRSFGPESVVTLDGVAYPIGGLRPAANKTQTAYLNRSAPAIADPAAFRYVRHTTAAPEAPFDWTPGARGSPTDVQWPPSGVHLTVVFEAPPGAPAAVAATTVEVHYEMYVGHPILTKWISVSTNATAAESWHEWQHRHRRQQNDAAEAPSAPCSGGAGCDKCPGSVYMRACSASGAAAPVSGESQEWSYYPANHSVVNSGMCLSSAGANPGSGCPHLTACNATDKAQGWELTVDSEHAGRLRSLDAASCAGVSPPGCCAAITGNRKDAGAWLNAPPCSGGEDQFALAGTHLIEVNSMLCAAAVPSSNPAPAPPSPPSPPGPGPPAPPRDGIATLTQIQVETLQLNQPYSPMPFVACESSNVRTLPSRHAIV